MFLIEGNIGAGKSTFLQLIQNHIPDLEIALEPVNLWQQAAHGQSLLQNFYTNPERWGYTMESFTLFNRIFENNKPTGMPLDTKRSILTERSIYSGYHCFAKNSYLNGFMTNLEWNIYQQLFSFFTQRHT